MPRTDFGPSLLLLDDDVAWAAAIFALKALAAPCAVGVFVLRHLLRRHRYLLRALAIGSSVVDSDDIVRLSSLPFHVTTVFIALATSTVVVFMVPSIRPALVDFETASSLALLGLIIVAAAALPLYVTVRAAVTRTLELANPAAMLGVLGKAEITGTPYKRLVWRLLIATATPVGFVAIGSSLIAHAHVRRFDAHSREETAEIISRVAFETSPEVTAGRAEAIEAARLLGFAAKIERGAQKYSVERGGDGRIKLTTPLENESAVLLFRVTAVPPITVADLAIAMLAVALAATLGLGIGSSLGKDLAEATSRVQKLGTNHVLFREESSQVTARYAQVTALNRAIDTLAARFRVFAEAQERAIDARNTARKLRSLLFASVSHDLRAPLNSILGFAELVRQKPLAIAQRESLGFIEQSGRELLALIETILDSAKIEAGRMALVRSQVSVGIVVAEAIRSGRLRAAARPLEFEIDVADGLPRILGDEGRLVQALAALIWYSARSGEPIVTKEGTVRPVELRVRSEPRARRVVIEVEAPNSNISPEELDRLLSPEPWAAGRRRYGSLTLGLALARSLVELHGGALIVKRTERGTALFEVGLPFPAEVRGSGASF